MQIHLVGGFLGSGKTSAIITAAKQLIAQGLKVGVITNDQGKYLVDSHFFRLQNLPTVEVTGGCFCCNYDQFDQNLENIIESHRPDVIFAESVGSCTDAVATVLRPLQKFKDANQYQSSFSVLVDARLLQAFLAGRELPFQEGIVYIFSKQIEETDVLVINKADLLPEVDRQKLVSMASLRYPTKTILLQSSFNDQDIQTWLRRIESVALAPQNEISLDYQLYGTAEQELAWYDAILKIHITKEEPYLALERFLSNVVDTINVQKMDVGHLKLIIEDQQHFQKISMTAQPDSVSNQFDSIDHSWNRDLRLFLNARVACQANELANLFQECIRQWQKSGVDVLIESEEAFHPGFPSPTHRMVGSPGGSQ